MNLHRIFENRLTELHLDARDPKTIERNRKSFERFTRWLAGQGLDAADVSELHLRLYFKELPTMVAATTARTEAQHVKTAYQYAAEDGLIAANPVTRRVKLPNGSTPEPEPYSHEDLRRIRAAIMDDLDEAIFYALAYGGLRRHELVELTRDDLDFEQAILRVVGKGDKPRRVPMHPLLARALRRYVRRHPSDDGFVLGRGGSLRNVNARFEKMLRRADVRTANRPAHRVRKTAATSLRREGVHTDVIDRIFGWAPVNVRQRYYSGVEDDELHEAIGKLYLSDPIEQEPSKLPSVNEALALAG